MDDTKFLYNRLKIYTCIQIMCIIQKQNFKEFQKTCIQNSFQIVLFGLTFLYLKIFQYTTQHIHSLVITSVGNKTSFSLVVMVPSSATTEAEKLLL